MNKIVLSIIVPVYNVQEYVKKCLDSLISQESDEYEIIIVNDGSTDNSLKICETYKDNKKVRIYTKENGGLSSARNYGLEKAKGEFVSFVDSDDWVAENYVSKIIETINSNSCDLITYDFIVINDGWKTGQIRKMYTKIKKYDKKKLIQECFSPSFSCARVYKKNLISKIKFPKENHWYEDMATTPIVLAKCNKMEYLEEPLYYYRQRKDSITYSSYNPKTLGVINAWENSLTKMPEEFLEDYVFALYNSIVTFINFKPEFAAEFIAYYNEKKELFSNNKLINNSIKNGKCEDLSKITLIPKKIHYCWFGNGEKGELFKKCLESWKKYAPDFEIIEWNESNCDINDCRYVKEAYENKKWAFVADYFRVKILNEYGGIYVDTDVEFHNYIHQLLLNNAFFGFETNIVNAAIFGCVPKCKLVNEVYKSYLEDKFVLDDGNLNTNYTIPCRLTDALKKNTSIVLNGKTQILEDKIKIYSADVLTLNVYNDANLAEHHYEATWWDAKMGVISYKYNVLQYYFSNVFPLDQGVGIKYHLRCIMRLVIPFRIRKFMKKVVGKWKRMK